jgi:hypothetical protein
MDIYLPAELLELRDELDDWRDLSSEARERDQAATAAGHGEGIDPSWLAI